MSWSPLLLLGSVKGFYLLKHIFSVQNHFLLITMISTSLKSKSSVNQLGLEKNDFNLRDCIKLRKKPNQ